MKRLMKTPLAALLGFVCLVAPSSPRAGGFLSLAIGPHAGYVYTLDSNEHEWAYGGAARLAILQILTAELAVQYQTQDTDAGQINTLPIQLSALLNVLPYLHGTIGVGYYNVDASLEGFQSTIGSISDTVSKAALHLGGGVNVPLSPHWIVTGEARYVFLNYDLETATQAVKVEADNLQITAGVLFKIF